MTITSIPLSDVVAAARAGRVPVAAETAGYLALAVADAIVRAPIQVGERGVMISPEGTVSVSHAPQSSSESAERALRELLGRLLDAAPASTPALGATARRAAGAGVGSLVVELEAALIPVNRGAARRALARLVRETERASRRRAPRTADAPVALARAASRPESKPPESVAAARPRSSLPEVAPRAPDPVLAVEPGPPEVPSLAPPVAAPRAPTLTGAPPAVPSLSPPPVLTVADRGAGLSTPAPAASMREVDIDVIFSPGAPAASLLDASDSARAGESIDVLFSPGPAETIEEIAEAAPEPAADEPCAHTEAGGPVFTVAPDAGEPGPPPLPGAAPAGLSASAAPSSAHESWDTAQVAEFVASDAPSVEPPRVPTPTVDVVEDELTSLAPAAVVTLETLEPPARPPSPPEETAAPEEQPSVPFALLRPSRTSWPPPPSPQPGPTHPLAPGAAAAVGPLPCLGSLTLTPAPPLFTLIAEADREPEAAPPSAPDPPPPAPPSAGGAPAPAPLALLPTAQAATVDELLAAFVPSDGLDERAVARSLKMMVGLDPTVAPPDVLSSPPPATEAPPSPSASPPPLASTLSPALAARPFRRPRSPRASLLLLWGLLLLGLSAILAVWVRYPGFFTGHSRLRSARPTLPGGRQVPVDAASPEAR